MSETEVTHVALIARERIEHGIEVVKTDRRGNERTEVQTTVVLPGETLLVDEDEAERLVTAGAADLVDEDADGEFGEDAEDETLPPAPKPVAPKAAKAAKSAVPASDNPSLVS